MSADSAFHNFQFRWGDWAIKIIITLLDTWSSPGLTFGCWMAKTMVSFHCIWNISSVAKKSPPQRPYLSRFPHLCTVPSETVGGCTPLEGWQWVERAMHLTAHGPAAPWTWCLQKNLREGGWGAGSAGNGEGCKGGRGPVCVSCWFLPTVCCQ